MQQREFLCFVNWHLCGTLNIARAHTAEYCDCSEATALYLVKGDQPLSLSLLLNLALSLPLSVAVLKRSLRGGLNSEPSFFFPYFSLLLYVSFLIVLQLERQTVVKLSPRVRLCAEVGQRNGGGSISAFLVLLLRPLIGWPVLFCVHMMRLHAEFLEPTSFVFVS